MITQHCFSLLSFQFNFSHKLSASIIYFDVDKNLFKTTKSQKVSIRVGLNFCLLLLWAFCNIIQSRYLYNSGDINLGNLGFAYQLAALLMIEVQAMLTWFPVELCQLMNTFLVFLHQFNGK